MDEEKQLKSALNWQYKPRHTESLIGSEVSSYLKQRQHTLTKNASIVDVWQAVIPPSLQPFCRLEKRIGRTLYLQAPTGPYMHQAQMLAGELLERIKQQIPNCGIQKIKIIPNKDNNTE